MPTDRVRPWGGAAFVFAAAFGTAMMSGPVGAQAPSSVSSAAPASQLPGGAQAISETYQDWQVNCAMAQGAKQCAVSQQQTDEKTRQRVLLVELHPRGGDKAEGFAFLPFGLALDKGVALKIDDAEVGPALRFRTCLPQGCLVPLSFDAKILGLMRKAAAFTLTAQGESDQPVAFKISLGGFAPSFDRVAVLAR